MAHQLLLHKKKIAYRIYQVYLVLQEREREREREREIYTL